jgi:hypothetical protein
VTADAHVAPGPAADAGDADEAPLVDPGEVLRAMEYYADRGWTDGLPVVPVTESYLAEFLAQTDRDPADVVLSMPHLNRHCTVRLAAINAGLAGCLPEYFPVVLAAWESLRKEGMAERGIWQSTTGTAPLLIVNGPIREAIGLNSKGNVFGSGFRANATIGRAIRLTAINAFGLRPHQLDQATQGTPGKYTSCIAENEEDSPWAPLHTEAGLAATDSAVTAMVFRSCIHLEARHTTVPEQLASDLANTISRTGSLVHQTISALLVLAPEHAHVFAGAGWAKSDLQRFIYDHAVVGRETLAAVGKDAVSLRTKWRLPAAHPDAMADDSEVDAESDTVRVLNSTGAVQVIVAGANNAGVSAVIETMGPRGEPPYVTPIAAAPARPS